MGLPAGRLHHGRNGRATRPAQQSQHRGLLGPGTCIVVDNRLCRFRLRSARPKVKGSGHVVISNDYNDLADTTTGKCRRKATLGNVRGNAAGAVVPVWASPRTSGTKRSVGHATARRASCAARPIATMIRRRRRRPLAPWTADKIPGGYVVRDTNGRALACAYCRATEAGATRAAGERDAAAAPPPPRRGRGFGHGP
jgi:hypothetical protein